MNRLDRYIIRQILLATFFVTLGLLAVMWLTQSLRFVELIVNRGLSLVVFLELTLLLVPNFLTMVLPIALFSVVLFTYNKLAQDRELVVMRSAGVGQFALARPALIVGLIATMIGYAITLYFLPLSYDKFRTLQLAVRSDVASVLLQAGSFNSPIPEITIYVQERYGESQLQGVMVHDSRRSDRPVTYLAKQGELLRTPQGPRVLLIDGSQQVVQGDGRMSMLYFDSYSIDLSGAQGAEEVRYREPRERWLDELFSTVPPEINERDVPRYRVEGHQRLLSPLQNLAFTVVAIACLITGAFTRRGQTPRILAAVGVMVLLQVASLGSAQLAVKNLTLVPLLYLVQLVPLIVGLVVLWRSQVSRGPARSREITA